MGSGAPRSTWRALGGAAGTTGASNALRHTGEPRIGRLLSGFRRGP